MLDPQQFKHEPKVCPRCQGVFECKVGTVEQCHCTQVPLNDSVQQYVRTRFKDCLCNSCLKAMSMEFRLLFFHERTKG